ncbi:hypothetical protein [Streptomyces liangshanensis]|uniref:hypothetical protein n=1 Tax=Streptomyces liangshanensis TaxID=2717324 RepID=UPI0036DAC1AE
MRKRKDLRTLEDSSCAELRAQLLDEANSCADYDPNSWQAALMFALADSTRYLNGEMRDI